MHAKKAYVEHTELLALAEEPYDGLWRRFMAECHRYSGYDFSLLNVHMHRQRRSTTFRQVPFWILRRLRCHLRVRRSSSPDGSVLQMMSFERTSVSPNMKFSRFLVQN